MAPLSWVETAIRGAQGALLIGCALLIASALRPFVLGALATGQAGAESTAWTASSAGAADGAPYQVIAARNLFAANEAEPSAEPIEESVELSALSVKLVGVIAPLAAVVQEGGSTKSRVVAPRDEIQGAVVERIEPRRLILLHRGQLEAIEFENDAASRTAAAPRLSRAQRDSADSEADAPARPPAPPAISAPAAPAAPLPGTLAPTPARTRSQDDLPPRRQESAISPLRGAPAGALLLARLDATAGPDLHSIPRNLREREVELP